ncbi:MAG: hypothetical protein QXX08_00115 [Candidatus Bathyarchaeia archaeon]
MHIEREVLVSVLKTTATGEAYIEDISKESRIPHRLVKKILVEDSKIGIIQIKGNSVVVNEEQRLKTALKAIELGADIERVCSFLSWKEFEDISIIAFEANDYAVKKHFRFSEKGRKWEIDILGLKEPIIISTDCKHWHHGWREAAAVKAVESQVKRTKILAEASSSLRDRINIAGWRHGYFVPLVLSLIPPAFKFYESTPVVPVLQLRNFLHELPAYLNEITHYIKSFEF